MAPIKYALAAFTLTSMLWLSPAVSAPSGEPLDLIQDRPSAVTTVFEYTVSALGWAWEKTTGALSVILPPSPFSLAKSVDADDQAELFTLLSYAGYKLKEIDSQVGVIPTIAFKFGLTRELSEADWDYLDYRLEVSRFRTPGLGAAIQRAIVGTVMNINTSGDYQVSELKVQVLPLPKVAFSVAPKVTALGDEASVLLRAIQKLERRLRTDMAAVTGRVLPGATVVKLIKAHNWIVGGSIGLFVLAILVELRRHLRTPESGRHGRTPALTLLGLGTTAWVVASAMPLSLLTMGGGVAVFGLTALLVAALGPLAAQPKPAVEAIAVAPAAEATPSAVAVHVTVETEGKAAAMASA